MAPSLSCVAPEPVLPNNGGAQRSVENRHVHLTSRIVTQIFAESACPHRRFAEKYDSGCISIEAVYRPGTKRKGVRQRVAEVGANLLIEAIGPVNRNSSRLVHSEQVFVLEDHGVPELTAERGYGSMVTVRAAAILRIEKRLVDLELISIDDSISAGDFASVHAHPALADNRKNMAEGGFGKHSPKHPVEPATAIVLAGRDLAIRQSHEELR